MITSEQQSIQESEQSVVSYERQQLQEKLLNLQDKKQHMDQLLEELQTLRDNKLMHTARECDKHYANTVINIIQIQSSTLHKHCHQHYTTLSSILHISWVTASTHYIKKFTSVCCLASNMNSKWQDCF
jgi:hypothetical protein